MSDDPKLASMVKAYRGEKFGLRDEIAKAIKNGKVDYGEPESTICNIAFCDNFADKKLFINSKLNVFHICNECFTVNVKHAFFSEPDNVADILGKLTLKDLPSYGD